ncbi:MAG: hypothetical protein PVG68_17010 [Desulfobacterales bacterium]|jgi:hypothetical protein
MRKSKAPKNQPFNKRSSGDQFALRVVTAVILIIAGCAADRPTMDAPPAVVGQSQRVGELAHPQLKEVSGLSASSLYPGLLWAINDGGDDPLLYAVSSDGADLGTFLVEGAKNLDWEALSSFRLPDGAYLLVADVGDNWQQRQSATLYVVKEPGITAAGLDSDRAVPIAWQIDFTYEDGPQDCEAAAVDPVNQSVLLLTKRGLSPTLYEVPLKPADSGTPAIARRLTSVPHFNWPTDMDLSPDGLAAVVLTYNHAYLFRRRPKDDWPKAFQKKPQRLLFETLMQQEAIAFGFYGKSVWLTSERRPAPLVRIDLGE